MESKICTKCGQEKSVDDFSKDKRTPDGLVCHCKDCIKNYKHQWHLDNRERTKEHDKEVKKEYRKTNVEKIKKQSKEYYKRNKEKLKTYYEENKERLKQYNKEYRNKNWNRIRQCEREAQVKKRQDPFYNLKDYIRNRIRATIKSKGYSKKNNTLEILGCSFEEFKLHIESQFEPWMNWNNHGNPKDGILELNKTWDLDHIEPIFNAKTIEDVVRLNHYTNFQPLCSYKNRIIKRNKT